ncbi:hypothetical protein SLE2022_185510 [Rubroshorea leprosula]
MEEKCGYSQDGYRRSKESNRGGAVQETTGTPPATTKKQAALQHHHHCHVRPPHQRRHWVHGVLYEKKGGSRHHVFFCKGGRCGCCLGGHRGRRPQGYSHQQVDTDET